MINFMTELNPRDVKMLKTNEIKMLLLKSSNNLVKNTQELQFHRAQPRVG